MRSVTSVRSVIREGSILATPAVEFQATMLSVLLVIIALYVLAVVYDSYYSP